MNGCRIGGWLEKLNSIGALAQTLDMFAIGDDKEDSEDLYK